MVAHPKAREQAYYVPFLAFMVLLFAGEILGSFFKTDSWLITQSQYWVKPLQVLVCGGLLLFYWRHYEFGTLWRSPRNLVWALGIGVLAFVLWITPVTLLGAAKRMDGFNPAYFGNDGWPYYLNLAFRFLRLVVVVPLVEEIFWRGFLMRWLINEKFLTLPFGKYQFKAFALVTLFFMLEHSSADYPAAFLTGLLYNTLAVRTMSLSACVLAHAVTNLLLGIFVMLTGQWGFW